MNYSSIRDLVREEVSEVQSYGRFQKDELNDIIKTAMRVKVIPKLWEIGKFTFLYNLSDEQTLTLSESSLDGDWVEADLSSLSSPLDDFYRPSLQAWINDDSNDFIHIDIRGRHAYRRYYYPDTYRERVLKGELDGNSLIVFDDTYDECQVSGIGYGYTSSDIKIDDDIVYSLLIPAMCSIVKRRDMGVTMERDYKGEFRENVRSLQKSMLHKTSAGEVRPPYYKIRKRSRAKKLYGGWG